MDLNVLTLNNVGYKYDGADRYVFEDINMGFEEGKVYTIIGQSGAGKSTLLSLISGLDTCKSGEVFYGKNDLKKYDRDIYRSKDIGVIFQSFNLLTNATVLENMILSMNISKVESKDKKSIAYSLLEKVGIDREKANRKTLRLSGGEQQRVGIARALAHNPQIIIADEPTGNLDLKTEQEILNIFTELAHNENKCIIIVTHSQNVTSVADIVLELKDGGLREVKIEI